MPSHQERGKGLHSCQKKKSVQSVHHTVMRRSPPLSHLKISAFMHMQSIGLVDGTEDWDTAEAVGTQAKDLSLSETSAAAK